VSIEDPFPFSNSTVCDAATSAFRSTLHLPLSPAEHLHSPRCRSPVLVLLYPQPTPQSPDPRPPSRQNQTLFLAGTSPSEDPKRSPKPLFFACHPLAPTPFRVLPPSSQPFTASLDRRLLEYLPWVFRRRRQDKRQSSECVEHASRIPTSPYLPQLSQSSGSLNSTAVSGRPAQRAFRLQTRAGEP